MSLTLTVLRCPDAVPPETREVTGGEFTIGRGRDNDWVLADPDKHLSKRHCVVAFRSGGWQLADTSSNGTFLNRDGDPIGAGAPRTLGDGDRIRLGPYEIEVRVREAVSRSAFEQDARRPDPFGDDPFGSLSPVRYRSDRDAGSLDRQFDAGLAPPPITLPPEFDPLAPDGPEEEFSGPTQPNHSPAVSDPFRTPPARSVLPSDWHLDLATPGPAPAALPIDAPAPEPEARAPVRVAPPPAAAPAAWNEADLLAAFLRGAGMPDARLDDPAHTMEQLGAALRALVSGIRRALIARAAVKSEFRIEQTMIRARGNNPLKFSADDDDALAALIGTGRRTDVKPEEAVADALTDIRLHELATMAAMQSAVRSLVARFAPEALRVAAEQAGGIPLPGARKGRAWDAFEALHAEVSRGLSDDFDSVFGKGFARAYEKALAEITGRDKDR
jgi:type VI secretion system FHA domain protein